MNIGGSICSVLKGVFHVLGVVDVHHIQTHQEFKHLGDIGDVSDDKMSK